MMKRIECDVQRLLVPMFMREGKGRYTTVAEGLPEEWTSS